MKPAGIIEGGAMGVPFSRGEAIIGVAPGRWFHRASGEAWTELLHLLLPAFEAGTHSLLTLHNNRQALAATLDALDQALLLLDLDGHELHYTRALRTLLAEESQRTKLLQALRRLARHLVLQQCAASKTHAPDPEPVGRLELQTQQAHYVLRGAFLEPGSFARDSVVAVSLERLTPRVPTVQALQARFGLTKREAEVARLLAQGYTNKAAGARLSISPHTVRSHAERLFLKLAVHTRKALALKLLGG